MDNTTTPSQDTEALRLRALHQYEILDTPPDGAFDNITAMAAQIFQVPIAIVSLVDYDRIWFKSHHGLDAQQIERSRGLCASAILQDSPYILEDTRTHPEALTNPLVAHEQGFRFYAAAQLKTPEGFNLGTICVIDYKPRRVDNNENKILETLAELVIAQMELRLSSNRVSRLHRKVADLYGDHHSAHADALDTQPS